ncbi:3-hexulose-6-phosphate synthase [Pyrofollis japonicus]|uniref:orotidine 5'-phosphate decarboxylase / HUMPS family protein n=1 Tax=Pyrofollis japonicus TaxID=3060460 RepID=UPI00295B2D05|nr:orotidine 5'-phosphate decarboxylase / HUMPS family protein [Pyrofollis japonicus]BEP18221.1 3-hexulose-6-phosphate synthase [Pyrofollis japonicus]
MKPRLLDILEKDAPVLQVALDYTRLEDALYLASLLRREIGDKYWIAEAGTPLIKAAGISSVRYLSEVVKPVPVVADTKTADTGDLETMIASDAGATALTVLGCTLDETIEAAAKEAHRKGLALIVDMVAVRDIEKRAEEVEALGADIVELHIGIDAQRALGMTAADLYGIVKRVSDRLSVYVSVAGGIDQKSAPLLAEAGASIIVVGGAIRKSRDPAATAKTIIESIRKTRNQQ